MTCSSPCNKADEQVNKKYSPTNQQGLNRLDIKLMKAIEVKPNGYFVELGANDGINQGYDEQPVYHLIKKITLSESRMTI